jgi:hypothetical protein
MSTNADVAAGSQELALGHLAEAVNECLRQGREPDVEQLVREHPALAEPIRQLVPALVLLHHVRHEDDAKHSDAESVASETSCVGQLGDFRIVREIGRGGMGIVYEAEQLSLRRRVALKVLPFAAVLDQRQLQRFKNEAQAAALLHHQNIVPVHGVGCERGVHYYAMQYVEGQSLDHVIASMRKLRGEDASFNAKPKAPAHAQAPRLNQAGAGACGLALNDPGPNAPAHAQAPSINQAGAGACGLALNDPESSSGPAPEPRHLSPADLTAAYSPEPALLSDSHEIAEAALRFEPPAPESEHPRVSRRNSPTSSLIGRTWP